MKLLFFACLFFFVSDFGFSQIKLINLKEVKQLTYKDYLNLKLEILSNSLSSGSFQTEEGRFEFPINISIDDSGFVNCEIYLNCDIKNEKLDIKIIDDEMDIALTGIGDLITEFIPNFSSDKLNEIIRAKAYINSGSSPIAIWREGKFLMVQ